MFVSSQWFVVIERVFKTTFSKLTCNSHKDDSRSDKTRVIASQSIALKLPSEGFHSDAPPNCGVSRYAFSNARSSSCEKFQHHILTSHHCTSPGSSHSTIKSTVLRLSPSLAELSRAEISSKNSSKASRPWKPLFKMRSRVSRPLRS